MVQTSESTAVVTPVERYQFTVEQYERMGELTFSPKMRGWNYWKERSSA